jgi:hypothetical protein
MTDAENDRLQTLESLIPEQPKNDIVRSRGEYPGEAGADWSFGATAKPEADEHYGRQKSAGLNSEDKRQGDLRDQTSNLRAPVRGEVAETQRSPHQAAQHGADVSGVPAMVQGSNREASLPEGLQRERKGPYDKNVGRKADATQVPANRKP